MQELTYCGPKNEICVQNQTLGNQQCLVPCEGLYADIADDSLNQKLDDVYAVVQQKIGGRILMTLSYPKFVLANNLRVLVLTNFISCFVNLKN